MRCRGWLYRSEIPGRKSSQTSVMWKVWVQMLYQAAIYLYGISSQDNRDSFYCNIHTVCVSFMLFMFECDVEISKKKRPINKEWENTVILQDKIIDHLTKLSE